MKILCPFQKTARLATRQKYKTEASVQVRSVGWTLVWDFQMVCCVCGSPPTTTTAFWSCWQLWVVSCQVTWTERHNMIFFKCVFFLYNFYEFNYYQMRLYRFYIYKKYIQHFHTIEIYIIKTGRCFKTILHSLFFYVFELKSFQKKVSKFFFKMSQTLRSKSTGSIWAHPCIYIYFR